jgi:hypothetical protein
MKLQEKAELILKHSLTLYEHKDLIRELLADNEAKSAIIDGYNLDMLMDVFKNEMEKLIVFTFDASRAKALNDAIEAVDAAGGDNEDYHIEAIKRKFGSEI